MLLYGVYESVDLVTDTEYAYAFTSYVLTARCCGRGYFLLTWSDCLELCVAIADGKMLVSSYHSVLICVIFKLSPIIAFESVQGLR